jgi:hypothetical protein
LHFTTGLLLPAQATARSQPDQCHPLLRFSRPKVQPDRLPLPGQNRVQRLVWPRLAGGKRLGQLADVAGQPGGEFVCPDNNPHIQQPHRRQSGRGRQVGAVTEIQAQSTQPGRWLAPAAAPVHTTGRPPCATDQPAAPPHHWATSAAVPGGSMSATPPDQPARTAVATALVPGSGGHPTSTTSHCLLAPARPHPGVRARRFVHRPRPTATRAAALARATAAAAADSGSNRFVANAQPATTPGRWPAAALSLQPRQTAVGRGRSRGLDAQ